MLMTSPVWLGLLVVGVVGLVVGRAWRRPPRYRLLTCSADRLPSAGRRALPRHWPTLQFLYQEHALLRTFAAARRGRPDRACPPPRTPRTPRTPWAPGPGHGMRRFGHPGGGRRARTPSVPPTPQ